MYTRRFAQSLEYVRSAQRWSVICSLAVAPLPMGCGQDCEVPLADCDADSCLIVTGERLEADETAGAKAAGCAPKDVLAVGAEIFARGPDNACWKFAAGVLPHGFQEDADCLPASYR